MRERVQLSRPFLWKSTRGESFTLTSPDIRLPNGRFSRNRCQRCVTPRLMAYTSTTIVRGDSDLSCPGFSPGRMKVNENAAAFPHNLDCRLRARIAAGGRGRRQATRTCRAGRCFLGHGDAPAVYRDWRLERPSSKSLESHPGAGRAEET